MCFSFYIFSFYILLFGKDELRRPIKKPVFFLFLFADDVQTSLDSKEDSYEGSRDHEVLGRPNIPELPCSIHKLFRVDLKITTY